MVKMWRLVICIFCFVSLFSSSIALAAGANTKEEKIKLALSAGPAQITDKATIMDMDGTVLRKGSNGWTCIPAYSKELDFPMCNDATWMAIMDALNNKKPFKTDKIGISYMLAGDSPTNNNDPFDTKQDPGETWVTEGPHLMLLVPDPDGALKGMSDDPNVGGPYVMFKGTSYAHVMVPIGPRK